VESAALLALEIARAGTAARRGGVTLAPEEKRGHRSRPSASTRSPSRWTGTAVLLAVDEELRRNPGVSLAEAAMHFGRERQVFASTWAA
jgi:hypothetical protein